MAKSDAKAIWSEAGLSLVTTVIILVLVKYATGKNILPESWVILYLLILIYLRTFKKQKN